jgi:HlyD family secretion protein
MRLKTAKKKEISNRYIVEEQEKKRNIFKHLLPLFIIIFVLFVIASLFIWYKYKPRAVGILYGKSYSIASNRNAFVREVKVKLGERIKNNQLLVELDTNTLESEKKALLNLLIVSKENIVSKTAELGLKQEELNLKLDDNLIFRAIDIQSARSALNEDMARLHSTKEQIIGVGKELERNKRLVAKKAVSQSVLDKIEASYNSLQKVVEHYTKVVNSDEVRYKTAIERYDNYKEKNYKVPVDEILRPLREKVKQANSNLKVIDEEIANSMLSSPIAGYVISIDRRNCSGVRAGDTIISVKEFSANIVETYIKECWVKYFKKGDILNLYPRSSIFSGITGKIVEISPDIMVIPPEYLSRYENSKEKGIRVFIKLDEEWNSYYGTTFDIER